MKTITILTDGQVQFLGDVPPVDIPLGKIKRRRVSVIWPVNFWKRMAFLFLRRRFGDRGRVADWTRRWSGPWKATILATGDSYVAESRQACIDWELETLRGPRFEL